MHLADHSVPRHISEFRGDLACRQSGFPELFKLLDAIVGPGQYRHRILPFASRRPIRGSAGDVISSQKSLRAESLSPRRARMRAWTCTPYKMDSKGSELPHEMSYPTTQTLQYGVTPAQESAPQRPHVPTSRHATACFPPHRNPTDSASRTAGKAVPWRVDSAPRPHRIPLTCRPKEAARFVSQDRLLPSSRQGTRVLRGRS